jgi:hypothetical protein
MAWVFSAEVGASDANSYLTTSAATDLLGPCFNTSAWDDATSDDQEKALAQASRDIDAGHRFRGVKYYGTLQALEWPRTCQEEDPTTIPADIRIACALQALWVLQNSSTGGRDERQTLRAAGVAEFTIGNLHERFTGGQPVGAQICPEAVRYLSLWIERTGRILGPYDRARGETGYLGWQLS